jgi:bifunctional DNA-binding transcriptional regulator/antitoxin component of YhaV-PrlF toxin-antitoxin module
MNFSGLNENIIQITKSGQLTIPAKLREFFPWLNQNSLIQAKPTPQGLLLQPLKTTVLPKKTVTQKKTAKELLKEFAEIAKGAKNPGVNLTDFVIEDRESH